MAERNHQSHRLPAAQPRVQSWQMEPPPRPSRGRGLLVMIALAGVAALLVVSDNEWEWRDTLRRLIEGESMPAFRAYEWQDVRAVRETLAKNLMKAEWRPTTAPSREHCRDLALHALTVAAGDAAISHGGEAVGKLLEELGLDVDWLEDIVYFCPLEHAGSALPLLAHIYRMEQRSLTNMPAHRRLAAAIAFEFARAGLDKDEALAYYLHYAAPGQKSRLNNRFDKLAIWELSALAARGTDTRWSGKTTYAWFQGNCRLPAQGYLHAGNILGEQETSLFGVAVDSPEFKAIYRDAAAAGTANLYQDSGCSTQLSRASYAASAACANGVPAIVVSAGADAACMVDVNGRWETSAPLPEGASSTWSFMGHNHPDFVRLAAALGADYEATLAGARLAQMGQFHYDIGNQPLAQSFLREAVKVQPLHAAAWQAYRAAGATVDDMQQAAAHFAELPGVAAALNTPAEP